MWGLDNWGVMPWGSPVPIPLMSPGGLVLLVAIMLAIGVLVKRGRGPRWATWTLSAVLLLIPIAAYAGSISIPNTFTNGTTADADEVNENFDALAVESNDQDSRLTTLEAAPSGLSCWDLDGDANCDLFGPDEDSSDDGMCTVADCVGPQGSQAVPGNDGADGAQGIQGVPGNDGGDGAQGIQGIPGNNGADGAMGL
jgi:hypothetical protein